MLSVRLALGLVFWLELRLKLGLVVRFRFRVRVMFYDYWLLVRVNYAG